MFFLGVHVCPVCVWRVAYHVEVLHVQIQKSEYVKLTTMLVICYDRVDCKPSTPNVVAILGVLMGKVDDLASVIHSLSCPG